MKNYLKPMENIVCMLMNNTTLAKWTGRKAVKATEQRVVNAARLTRRGLDPEVECFMSHEFVGELFPVLEPLLQI